MTEPGGLSKRALGFYGAVEAAVQQRQSTAELWDSLRAAAESFGLESPGLSLQDVNQLRSMAAGVRNSGEAFGHAQGSYGIDASMIASAPWSRPLAQQAGLKMFQVRFQHQTTGPNGPETNWRSVFLNGPLPPTKDDLLASIEVDAQQFAMRYGHEHVGIGSLTLLRV